MRASHSISERIAWHIMGGLRILLANEPRSYRETLAAALRVLRPEADVRTAEPEVLEREVKGFIPQLVVCSRLTPSVKTGALAWVELYPGHGPLSTVSVGGEHSVIDGIEFPNLLSVVDQTGFLAEADRPVYAATR